MESIEGYLVRYGGRDLEGEFFTDLDTPAESQVIVRRGPIGIALPEMHDPLFVLGADALVFEGVFT